MNRRRFLSVSAISLIAHSSPQILFAKRKKDSAQYLLSPARMLPLPGQTENHALVKINLISGEMSFLPIPFEGHDIIPIKKDQFLWLLTGKKPSPESWLININEMQIKKRIPSSRGLYFYGHSCVVAPDTLCMVEESESEHSQIAIWNIKEMKKLRNIPINGSGIHLVLPTTQKNIIAVGLNNMQSKMISKVMFINIESGLIDHEIKSYSSDALVDHFIMHKKQLFVGFQYTGQEIESLMGLSKLTDKTLTPLPLPVSLKKSLRSSSLSLAIDKSKTYVYATTTAKNSHKKAHILKWNYEEKKLAGFNIFDNTMGLFEKDNVFYFSYNGNAIGKFSSLNTNEQKSYQNQNQIVEFGSHLKII